MSESMHELDGGIGEFEHISSFLVLPMADLALGVWPIVKSETSVGIFVKGHSLMSIGSFAYTGRGWLFLTSFAVAGDVRFVPRPTLVNSVAEATSA